MNSDFKKTFLGKGMVVDFVKPFVFDIKFDTGTSREQKIQ